MGAKRCPFCGAACEPTDKFCVQCGSRLGAPSIGRPLPQPPGEEEEELVGPARTLQWFMEYLPGLFRPRIVILSVGALVIAAGVGALALFLAALATITAMFIGGFAMVIYWTAVAWIIYGELCMPSDALADFNSTQWLIFALLGALPIVGTLILFGLAGS